MKPYPRALLWVAMLSAIVLMAASLWLLRVDSTNILTAGIPALLAMCGVDRWAAAWAVTRAGEKGP